MQQRIFKGSMIVALVVLAASLVIIFGALYSRSAEDNKENLRNETYLVAEAVETRGADCLKELKKDYLDKPGASGALSGDSTSGTEESAGTVDGASEDSKVPSALPPFRVTYIAADGTVIYDTQVDKGELGSHKNRPEVQEALKKGRGESQRYSRTLSRRTYYCAVRLNNGNVVRVSNTRVGITSLLYMMIRPFLLVLVIALLLAFLLSRKVARNIVEPINKIDPANPYGSMVYDELKPLTMSLIAQNRTVNEQLEQLASDVEIKTREAAFRQEFTANVSHELKTPLTSISGFAEILRSGMAGPEEQVHFAGRIYDEAQRLIFLVDDILKLSQLDENQVTANPERLDLADICEDVEDTLAQSARAADITLKCEGESAPVQGVYPILEEIIYNLCDNAIKYNEPGGWVTMTTGFMKPEGTGDGMAGHWETAEAAYEAEAPRPFVRVSDNGIGIPRQDQNRVFERFYRVNKSHSKEIGGTGLGLSIVKHGAAFHHAKIQIDSTPGAGTTITVIFPPCPEGNGKKEDGASRD